MSQRIPDHIRTPKVTQISPMTFFGGGEKLVIKAFFHHGWSREDLNISRGFFGGKKCSFFIARGRPICLLLDRPECGRHFCNWGPIFKCNNPHISPPPPGPTNPNVHNLHPKEKLCRKMRPKHPTGSCNPWGYCWGLDSTSFGVFDELHKQWPRQPLSSWVSRSCFPGTVTSFRQGFGGGGTRRHFGQNPELGWVGFLLMGTSVLVRITRQKN